MRKNYWKEEQRETKTTIQKLNEEPAKVVNVEKVNLKHIEEQKILTPVILIRSDCESRIEDYINK